MLGTQVCDGTSVVSIGVQVVVTTPDTPAVQFAGWTAVAAETTTL